MCADCWWRQAISWNRQFYTTQYNIVLYIVQRKRCRSHEVIFAEKEKRNEFGRSCQHLSFSFADLFPYEQRRRQTPFSFFPTTATKSTDIWTQQSTYPWSNLNVSFTAKINDAIGADSEISPLYNCCMKYGALSFRSSTWMIAEHVADADAIFVARMVKL